MQKIFLGLLLIFCSGLALAQEFSGNIALELQHFPQQAQQPGQFDQNLTLSFEPRWTTQWNEGDDAFSAELFLRVDNKDDERQHADIRELLWLHLSGEDEWRVGINTLFWGVTESQHLVDVVNQIDLVEGIDREEKLGQPMIHLKHYEDYGVFDFLVLPGFRERSFHASEGRLRTPLVTDGSLTQYESGAAEHHIDYAIRFSRTYGDLDLGVSGFKGTNRDPQLIPGLDRNGQPVLIPRYAQMTQIGLDLQLIDEEWTWKLELIHRDSEAPSYQALTGGFEYTFYGIFASDIDLGTLAEYSWENRDKTRRGAFDRDLLIGARLAFNDVQSSELLAGFVIDTERHSQTFRVEASRRIGDSWKASLEALVFSNIDKNDVLAVFENDDFLLIEIARYF